MSPSAQTPQVEIHDSEIDHVNVIEAKTSKSAQDWKEKTPLLTVLITALSVLFGFCFNIVQNHTSARQKTDSDWREALSKGINNEQGAALIVLEMETFAADPVYGSQAKSIVYSALPRIKSEIEFDTAFHGALDGTLEEDQDALVSVLRKLSLDLQKLHDDALKTEVGLAADDRSLAAFVKDPATLLPADSPAVAEATVLTWKLDSASVGLSSLWRGSKTRRALKPMETVDLTGLIFLNNDFRRVDFSQVTDMSNTFFLGKCKVDKALPKGAIDGCETR